MTEENPIGSPIKLDFYREAVVGVDLNEMRVAYSKQKMIEKVITEYGLTLSEAIDYLSEEYWQMYLGKHTPIYLDDYDYIYE